jgi:hypothetical protein
MQLLYGPPPSYYQEPLYLTVFKSIFNFIFSPTLIILCFFFGTLLYLKTHKQIFIRIPFVLAILYFLYNLFSGNRLL